LHKLVTNATPLNVWRQLKEGHNGFAIVSRFPDEFHDYIWNMIEPLEKTFEERYNEILDNYERVLLGYTARNLSSEFDRGGFARYIRNEPDKRYYFMLLDDKPIRTVLWSELRPREATDGESENQGEQTHPS
jgi:RNA ligase